MIVHPRVGLHQVAFLEESTAAFVEHCHGIGVRNVTLVTPMLMRPGGVDEAHRALRGTGVRVESVNHQFATYPDLERDAGDAAAKLLEAIDVATALGARSVYLQTGARGRLSWEAAAERFATLIAPCVTAATDRGVRLLVENASAFTADIHMVHTLADAAALAELSGIGVCIEWHACWMEGGLETLLGQVIPMTGLVQVSDYVLGDRTSPCRAVPGDGVIPLDRIIGDVLEAGYAGVFDIELVGPRIQAEGPRAATERAARRVSEILTRLGA
jgi:sugar phosphate isomerase/epimerase